MPVLDGVKHALASSTLPGSEEVSGTPDIKIPAEEIHEIKGPSGDQIQVSGPKYLLALDETPDSEAALKWALEHVQPESHVFLVSVLPDKLFDPVHYANLEGAYGVTGFGDVQQNINYFRAARKLRVKALEHHAEELTAKGIQVTIHVLHGDARYAICRVADFHNVDSVIMGRRKPTGLRKLISGFSVTSYVVQHCSKTVVIAKGH